MAGALPRLAGSAPPLAFHGSHTELPQLREGAVAVQRLILRAFYPSRRGLVLTPMPARSIHQRIVRAMIAHADCSPKQPMAVVDGERDRPGHPSNAVVPRHTLERHRA
jgi:hypothetical protein